MNYLDEIAQCGPKDIYEKAVMSLNAADAMEFLLLECQHKQRLINILSLILKQEAGEEWWQMYADHIVTQGRDLAGEMSLDQIAGPGKMAMGDIPL